MYAYINAHRTTLLKTNICHFIEGTVETISIPIRQGEFFFIHPHPCRFLPPGQTIANIFKPNVASRPASKPLKIKIIIVIIWLLGIIRITMEENFC